MDLSLLGWQPVAPCFNISKDGSFDPADPWAQRSIMQVPESVPEDLLVISTSNFMQVWLLESLSMLVLHLGSSSVENQKNSFYVVSLAKWVRECGGSVQISTLAIIDHCSI